MLDATSRKEMETGTNGQKLSRASILENSTRAVRKVSADNDNLTNLVRLYLV